MRLAKGDQYHVLDAFLYMKHPLLETYEMGKTGIGHYMVDCKSIYRVSSNFINRSTPTPDGMKLLELSIPSRAYLREKIRYFFSRVPDEDKIELEI